MAQVTNRTGLVYADGRQVTRTDVHQVRAQAAMTDMRGRWLNAYDAAARDGAWMAGWNPSIRSPDASWGPERDLSIARIRDLRRNDPVAGAGVARRVNSVVGEGWLLASKPNARLLGITPAQARELAAQIEAEWNTHADGHAFECDAERSRTFGQLLRIVAHGDMGDGEGLALIEWAEDEGTRYKTRLRLVDPDRLSTPAGRTNSDTMRDGVERNKAGVPWIYHIREAHPADYMGTSSMKAMTWAPFERFTAWGRPQVLHWFEATRPGESRGVSRFVATLKSFRALSRFTDATLQSATINALFAAFVQSSAGPEAVSEHLQVDDVKGFETAREKFYDENPVVLGGEARIPVLPYGDEIKMATASKDVTSFDAFTRAIIKLIAASLGVTYEEISMDFSQTNYSSARAAMIYALAEAQAMFGRIKAQLVRPYYVAWLEEAFDRGYIVAPAGAPDFYDAIDAYAGAEWIGPGKGVIDPVKEAAAATERMANGTSSRIREAAAGGQDWRQIVEEQASVEAYEAEVRKSFGLGPKAPPLAAGPGGAADPAGEGEGKVAPEDGRPGQPQGRRSGARGDFFRMAISGEHDAFLDQRWAA